MRNTALTAAELRTLVRYDPLTGEFSEGKPGRVQAPYLVNGYTRIVIDGRSYRAHRLAWLFQFGCWPAEQIDHINGVRTDNRIENLREVTNAINNQNLKRPKSNNRTGLLGVHWSESAKCFRARIGVAGKQRYLGSFQDPQAAHHAYLTAKRALHAGCTI